MATLTKADELEITRTIAKQNNFHENGDWFVCDVCKKRFKGNAQWGGINRQMQLHPMLFHGKEKQPIGEFNDNN